MIPQYRTLKSRLPKYHLKKSSIPQYPRPPLYRYDLYIFYYIWPSTILWLGKWLNCRHKSSNTQVVRGKFFSFFIFFSYETNRFHVIIASVHSRSKKTKKLVRIAVTCWQAACVSLCLLSLAGVANGKILDSPRRRVPS